MARIKEEGEPSAVMSRPPASSVAGGPSAAAEVSTTQTMTLVFGGSDAEAQAAEGRARNKAAIILQQAAKRRYEAQAVLERERQKQSAPKSVDLFSSNNKGGSTLDAMMKDSDDESEEDGSEKGSDDDKSGSGSGNSDESSEEDDDDIDWSTMSDLAIESREAAKRLGMHGAMKKRHAHFQPRHELDKKDAAGWRSLSPTKDVEGKNESEHSANQKGRGMGLKGGLLMKIASGTQGQNKAQQAFSAKSMLGLEDISKAFIRSRQIAGALRTAPEFEKLTEAQLAMLAHGGEERRYSKFSVLFREGSDAHSFYVLLKGRLQHSTYHSSHKHIIIAPTPEKDEGVCLGTEGLSGGLRRLTTATAMTECTVLRFSTSGIRIDRGGAADLAARASHTVVTAALRGNRFFESADEKTREELAQYFKLEEIGKPGEFIIEEGGVNDKLCILLEGKVSIEMGGKPVAELPLPDDDTDPEPVFGEGGYLDDAPKPYPSNISIVTKEACKILVVKRPKFGKLSALMPGLKQRLRGLHKLRASLMSLNASASFLVNNVPGSVAGMMQAIPGLNRAQAAMVIQRTARGRAARKRVGAMKAGLGIRAASEMGGGVPYRERRMSRNR